MSILETPSLIWNFEKISPPEKRGLKKSRFQKKKREDGKRALKKAPPKQKKKKEGAQKKKKTAGKKEGGIGRPPFYLTYPANPQRREEKV